jgi:ribosomal protein S12 methylthiotransferase accessory factor
MEIVFPGGKKVDAMYKGLRIRTDQSGYPGADESLPAPFDLFLASIGTCAGIYVLVFCQKRSISTEGPKLIQRAERNVQTGMIEKITI